MFYLGLTALLCALKYFGIIAWATWVCLLPIIFWAVMIGFAFLMSGTLCLGILGIGLFEHFKGKRRKNG